MNDETQQNPYAPPEARVSDFTDADEDGEPASRGIRFGAAMIDWLMLVLAFSPSIITVLVNDLTPRNFSAGLVSASGLMTLLLLCALAGVTLVLVAGNGQTIGKKLVGIRVVRSDGSRASLGRIFWLRNIVNGIPSAIPIVGNFYFFLDHLFIFGVRRQCIHDLIADTIVVRA